MLGVLMFDVRVKLLVRLEDSQFWLSVLMKFHTSSAWIT
jgi:hypothetical protein